MAGGKLCGSSNMAVLFQNGRLPCSAAVFESLWVPSSDHSLQGSASTFHFENFNGRDTIDDRPFFQPLEKDENGEDDIYDVLFEQAGKKRRLTTNQVQFLEKNFESENKLEPERKVQIAKQLGMQPRQVAIWFQNKRARYKTKQLEKDYFSLKVCYDKLQIDYENLLQESENMKKEISSLKGRLGSEEKGNGVECVDAVNSPEKEPIKAIQHVDLENGIDMNSAKSDVLDSDSQHCTDPNHSSFLDPSPRDSSNVLEPDYSDYSQDEEENLSKSFLPFDFFPKAEHGGYDDQPENSSNIEFPVEEQPFYFWSF